MVPSRLADFDDATSLTRVRKLHLRKLIVFLLSLSASGHHLGDDGKFGEFFQHARRSGLLKVPSQTLQDLFAKSVRQACDHWPGSPEFSWCGRNVIAIDSSEYMLPATQWLRDPFDPDSGLDSSGKGYFPQCLATTAYDLFRRLSLA